MKLKLLCCLLIFLLALPVMALPPKGEYSSSNSQTIDNATFIDVNRILAFVTNHGNMCRDLSGVFGYDYGTWFPYTGDTADIGGNINTAGDKSPNYATGIWIGARIPVSQRVTAEDSLRVVVSEYSSEYVPGPAVLDAVSGEFTFGPDKPEYRVYKIYRDSMKNNPNQDYLDYMNFAVDQGAPTVIDDQGDEIPELIGDQMLWSVFNDFDSLAHDNNNGETRPLGLEIKQTVFGFDRQGSLGNMIFMRYRIYNKGTDTLQECYMSIWTDPDLGTAGDDFVGCDTMLGLGYVYNDGDHDNQYGDGPPAMGIDFFQGPMVPGAPEDTAIMWGFQKYPGMKNLGMVSFNKYINGTDPDDYVESYWYMQGLDAKNSGAPYVYNGVELLYQASGDPVLGTGDLDVASDDRRMMQTTGPITFAPGDSTEIIAAMIVGQGETNLNSITILKNLDNFAQGVYDNGFNPPAAPARPVVKVSRVADEVILAWGDTSEVDQGAYEFEGYTVWQGDTKTGPWRELVTFDVINDRTNALVDTIITNGLEIKEIKRGIKNTDLQYYYTTATDVFSSLPFNNYSTYYFRVSAFSYAFDLNGDSTIFVASNGDTIPKGDRFLENVTTLTIKPEGPGPGWDYGADPLDTLPVAKVGPSDGGVYPIVLDPFALTGDTYQVTFTNNGGVITWDLKNLTTGTTIYADQTNQSGDETYLPVDGMLIKVIGPPLEGKDWDYTSASPLNVSPVMAAEKGYAGDERWLTGGNHGGELLYGGVFMEPNFWGSTSVPLDGYPVVEVRFRPMASYTDQNGDGTYTIGEPYVVDDPAETQNAFMYSTFSGAAYTGFNPIPFTAWDVTDPANERQLNVVVRDRDQNGFWQLHVLHDPAEVDITGLANGGDFQYNYVWILTTDYDATGTMYGDGTGGTIDFWDYDGGNGVYDGAWVLWLDERGSTRGMLAEECTLTLIPPNLNLPVDTFTFTATLPSYSASSATAELEMIKTVPNPFYMNGPYDPSPGNYNIQFTHLPETCTIKIYNLVGDLVRTLEKDNPLTNTLSWDVLTESGLPPASGIYVYVVDAPGIGTKVGKMAVFVEDEVLRIY